MVHLLFREKLLLVEGEPVPLVVLVLKQKVDCGVVVVNVLFHSLKKSRGNMIVT
jgi:hypothetical protein